MGLKALILAAGRGTRLQAVDPQLPKVLHKVGETSCLERILLGMQAAGITEAAVVIGFQGDLIREAIGDGGHLGLRVQYVEQDLRRYGTGAAIWTARSYLAGQSFLFSFGDILVHPENYRALRDTHQSEGTPVLGVNWVEDPAAGAAVYLDDQDCIEQIVEKPEPGTANTHWNSSGVALLTDGLVRHLEHLQPSARGEYELTHGYQAYLRSGRTMKAHRITGYWQDIGRPEDLARVQAMAAKGEL